MKNLDKLCHCAGIVLAGMLTGSAMGANAQPTGASDAASPASSANVAMLQSVVVTATRLSIPGFQAPTPTTVLSARDLAATSPANVADAVNQLPQMVGSATPQNTGAGVGGGLGGANILNLRDLGTDRTLVLLNGRRVTPAATTGVVDVNMIPSQLLSRVDVVTEGASAAWGSDALAGVVNFVLNDRFTGFKAEVQGGESTYGDAANEKVQVAWGTDFAHGRGHLVAAALYGNQNGVKEVASRPWYDSTKLVRNPTWAAGNGQPYYIVASRVGVASGSDGGLITTGPLKGTMFGPGGTTSPFVYGTPIPGGVFQLGGTFVDYAGYLPLLAKVQQESFFSHATFDFTDNLQGFAEAMYGRSYVPYYTATPGQGVGISAPPITIHAGNPFIPASVAAEMAAQNISSFTLGRMDFDGLQAQPVNTRQTFHLATGLKGAIGSGWTWNVFEQFGETFIDNNVENNTKVADLPLAADAVTVTAANVGSSGLPLGSIACRSTLTAPDNGCVPENVFGYGAPSKAALAYLTGTAHQEITLKQNDAGGQVNGSAFSTWAGPEETAAGFETRSEEMFGDADPISQANGWFVGNYHPLSGRYTVSEGFVEANLPLAKDLPLAKHVDFDGAVRYTRYSTSGGVMTYKAGIRWQLTDAFTLRGTRSRDIRAPNLNDLFLSAQNNTNTVTDPANGGASDQILATTKGNPALKPEVANSWSAGIVFQPRWLNGFGASLDYYDIRISDAIASFSSQQLINYCYQGETVFCPAITRGANGAITGVTVEEFNANSEVERGFDIEAQYNHSLDGLHLPGAVSLRLLASNIQERTVTAGGATTNYLGELAGGFVAAGPPKWKGLAALTYRLHRSDTTVQARYIGSGVVDNTFTQGGNAALFSINNNHISSVTYWDLTETLDLTRGEGPNIQAYVTVQDLFNRDPPVAVGQGPLVQAITGTSPTYYDVLGRQFRGGVRVQF